jgi:HD-GYP domain-containing protein (c-di-GMP phosphodiesterase class II)
MILVPAAELVEDMIVASDVRDRNHQLIIARGARLNASSLRLLQRLDADIYIAEGGEMISNSQDEEQDEINTEFVAAMEQATSGFQCNMEARNICLDSQMAQGISEKLRADILAQRQRLVTLMKMRGWSERLFQHSFNTAILAAVLAKESGQSEENCRLVALGMMFHDCGQLFLPREVFEKQGKLTEEELKIARRHPQVGYQHVFDNGILPPAAANIVLQHHERPDGAGYPQSLSADQIEPLARIAGVVETFDAMTSLRAYARAAAPDEAMKTILGQVGKAFDKQIALFLTKHIALYPTGTAVRFNTGESGIVVSLPQSNPNRPVVRLFFGPDGRRIAATEIHLASDSSRHIVQSGANVDDVKMPARV